MPAVVMLLDKLMLPETEKSPLAIVNGLPAPSVKVPEFVMANVLLLVKLFKMLKLVPRKVPDPIVVTPLKVVAPVAAFVCVNAPESATAPLKLTAPELVMVRLVKPVLSADVPVP